MATLVEVDGTAAASGAIDEITRLRAVAELSRAIGVEHDLRKVLGRVLDTCFQLLAADRGAIAILYPGSKNPQLTLARERNGHESQFALSTTVVSVVMETHQPHVSAESDADADAAPQRSASPSVHSARSLMAAPLLYRAADVELLGVIQLDARADTGAFLPRDVELLSAIAGQAALAIKNAMLVEQLTRAAHHDRLALVGQLAGGIAHDFNNLLSIMLTYASMLEESISDPGMRADIQTIARAASSASQLTRQLLVFSHRELVTPTVIDPAIRVRSLDSMLRRLLGEHIELETQIAGRVPHLLIDGAQFEQIVVNLVINARDAIAGRRRGRVRLRLSQCQLDDRSVGQLPAGCYALLEVEDTGSGMSPEVQSHIFEPYSTTEGQLQGSGLGLATVHAIVGQSHGDIAVTSELGRGTTFRIFLPETDRPLEAAPGEAEPAPRDGGTVLVVDDDDDVRRMVERALRRARYTVMTATSGPDALARARAHPGEIDLLLTDLAMPGMTGQELIRELSTERPGLQVVFMSGYHQGAPIDPRRFVAKPFDRATLLSTVADVLANRHGHEVE